MRAAAIIVGLLLLPQGEVLLLRAKLQTVAECGAMQQRMTTMTRSAQVSETVRIYRYAVRQPNRRCAICVQVERMFHGGREWLSALPPPPPLERTPLSTARGPTRASAQLRAGQPSRTAPAVPYSSSRFDPPAPPASSVVAVLPYVQDLVRCAGGRRVLGLLLLQGLSPSLPPVRVNARARDAKSEPRSHYCIPFTSADCSAAHMRDCFISAAEPPRFDLNRCRDHRAAATERARMAVAKPAKDTFVLSCTTAYTATGMYLHPQMKMQNASLGLMRNLKRSAEASPEEHAAILHGIEKRGLLQRAQSVAS